jgi:hypothetical protein
MSSERIPDLHADGTPTGRYLAVAPDGRLAGIRDGDALKTGWRLATADDVAAKKAAAEPALAEHAPSE